MGQAEGNEWGKTVFRILRDIIIGIVAGIVIDATLRYFVLEFLFPALPYIWLSILIGLTFVAFKRSRRISNFLVVFYGRLSRRRLMVSYFVVALIGTAIAEVYWIGIKKIFELREVEFAHVIRKKAFSTIIPFALDSFHAGIPYDANQRDPLLLTYTELAGISDLPTRFFEQTSGKLVAARISPTDIEDFLGHVMQYYILRTVNELQNPVTYTNLEPGKGISTDTNSPVSVPDEKEYPNEKLFKLLEKLTLRFGVNSGPNDWMWKQFKMKIPSGTKIDFVQVANTGKTNYIVRFERAPDLLLDFRIEPTLRNRGVGTFPKNFVPARAGKTQDAYSYVFTIHVELRWKGDHSVGQEYVEWANGLEAGLRRKLVVP